MNSLEAESAAEVIARSFQQPCNLIFWKRRANYLCRGDIAVLVFCSTHLSGTYLPKVVVSQMQRSFYCPSSWPLAWDRLPSGSRQQYHRSPWQLKLRVSLESLTSARLHTQAAAVLERVLTEADDAQEDWIYSLRRAAREHQKKGEYEQAKSMLRDGLLIEPNSCSLLTSLANVLGREQKADEARLVYSQAAAADPSSSVPIQVRLQHCRRHICSCSK